MKKYTIFALLLAATVAASAQYQLPNAGFEQWDGGNTSEPTHWNSFATSDGSYSSLASSPHHYRRSGHRPGGTGSYYLTIYTKSILGIKANGNMTTGRIHAGSMSAESSDNYNYTQRSNSAHCQPFSGTPDSMYVWVSFYAASGSSQAQVSAILHGDNDFKAPNEENTASKYCGKAAAHFTRTTSSASSMHWQQVKVPFTYNGTATPAYMLVNITTNKTPGAGDGNDSLSIDDIEFVYSSWLTGINIAGHPLSGFEKGCLSYTVRVADSTLLDQDCIEAVAEAADATVSIERAEVDTVPSTTVFTITVMAEDGVSTHTYTVRLTTDPSAPSGIDPVGATRLAAWPSPTADILHVDAEGEVALYDMGGRLLRQTTAHGTASIDMTDLPAGIYLLRCGSSSRQVVKQ